VQLVAASLVHAGKCAGLSRFPVWPSGSRQMRMFRGSVLLSPRRLEAFR
jgi:hypothetical protein